MEEQHKGCDVRHIGQVKTAPTLASTQGFSFSRAYALLPHVVKNPCLLGIHPEVYILGHHIADSLRSVLGIIDLIGEVFRKHRDSKIGVGLDPHLRVVPFLFAVKGVDDPEEGVVLIDALQHLDDIAAIGIAGSVLIESGSGDYEHERLPSCTEC